MAASLGIFLTVGLAAYFVYLSDSLVRPERTGFELPVLVLIAMLIMAGSLLIWSDRDDFNVTIITGLLVAGSALFGLVFNAAVARQSAYRQRQEKRADMRRALRAEIDDYVRELRSTADKRGLDIVEKAFATSPEFVPFLATPRRDRVFSTILQQVEVLDDRQVETVVRFYALHEKVVDLAMRMQSDQYAQLPKDRRQAVLNSLNGMEDLLVDYGTAALATLGDLTAKAAVNPLNKKDRARSDREVEV